jgi:hypothetical protein
MLQWVRRLAVSANPHKTQHDHNRWQRHPSDRLLAVQVYIWKMCKWIFFVERTTVSEHVNEKFYLQGNLSEGVSSEQGRQALTMAIRK